MNIKSCMKRNVVSIHASDTIGQAASLIVSRHIGMLPVVNDDHQLVGILTLLDLLTLIMPDFVRLVENFDFVHDFGALEARQPTPEMLAQPVEEVMRPPVWVEESSGLLRAVALLRRHDLSDLPVVSDDTGQLTGIASRVDIGTALLAGWRSNARDELV